MRKRDYIKARVLTIQDTPYWQFLKFAITGFTCVVIELSILTVIVELLGQDYLYTGNSLAFSVAVGINYIISRLWVFEPGKYSAKIEFMAFCLMAVVGLGINYMILWLVVEFFHIHYLVAKLIAIATVVAWNFFSKKYIVFKG